MKNIKLKKKLFAVFSILAFAILIFFGGLFSSALAQLWSSNLTVCADSVSVSPSGSSGVYNANFYWDWNTYAPPGTQINTSTCPANFRIQIDDNSDFSSPVYDQQAGASNPYSTALSLPGGVYYWRISIYTSLGATGGYSIWTGWAYGPSFTITPPPGNFTLSLGGSVACNFVPLSWTASSGAEGYKILKGAARVDISPYQPYTAQNFTDTTVSQNTTYQYQIEAYNAAGTNRSNVLNVTTPYCPPTVDIKANGSDGPISIYQGQSVTLSWSSAYSTSMMGSMMGDISKELSASVSSLFSAASGGWGGSMPLNGSQVVVPLPPSATFTLTGSGPGGSVSDSVTINITPLALPDWREIIPR